MTDKTDPTQATTILELAYAADNYRRYPGEPVKLYARLIIRDTSPRLTRLMICLPPELEVVGTGYRSLSGRGDVRFEIDNQVGEGFGAPRSASVDYDWNVYWDFTPPTPLNPLAPDQAHEFWVETKVAFLPRIEERCLKSWARAFSWPDEDAEQNPPLHLDSEVIAIHYLPKARALGYLPAVYHDESQELLWRYLMVFDHVWAQYEDFLKNQTAYFDPHTAPDEFKQWLASWVGLVLDKRLPEVIQRRLIMKMASLYLKRGTRQGLLDYLRVLLRLDDVFTPEEIETYIERYIKIDENVAGNFILSDETKLDNDLIVGSADDKACTFSVSVTWPRAEYQLDEALVREAVMHFKPAHVKYVDLLNKSEQALKPGEDTEANERTIATSEPVD